MTSQKDKLLGENHIELLIRRIGLESRRFKADAHKALVRVRRGP